MNTGRRISAVEARGGIVLPVAIDQSFPTEKVHGYIAGYGITIDLAEFDEFFGLVLGCHRAIRAGVVSAPSAAMELSLIAELKNAMEQVRTRISNLPPSTSTSVIEACIDQYGKTDAFPTLLKRIESDLKEMRMLLLIAEKELRLYAGRAGRKHAFTRDFLLHDVASRLFDAGMPTKRMAAACAADILRACNVPAPSRVTDVEKIIRKAAREYANRSNS